MYYIHKHEISLDYGGPEEGGWNYERGTPVAEWKTLEFEDKEKFYEKCRELNFAEQDRRKNEEDYPIHSVLAYKSTFYTYGMQSGDPTPTIYPEYNPHYE